MSEEKVIIVNPDMFGKDAESKTDEANTVTKSFGISDDTLAEVEDFKAQLTKHNAWDLPVHGIRERRRIRLCLCAGRRRGI